ncbi:hypothetical protein CSOJ01_01680 [Colletotrichum sojae]|uniref:Protein phosphatase 4 core regulatory subunit R2 n=1 Tax=Colletotrichum sojae TaxID=2175907 RepID=A0A8H6JSR1_9PEZI|nr:hypothetical protein CSOJ01_01680 [Colletotrichum sojae]
MEIEVDDDLLRTVASGGQMDYGLWPALSQGIITRLDKIVHNDFPIPKLPRPNQHIYAPGQLHPRLLSPLPSSSIDPPSSRPSSQDADKENQPTIPNPTLASRPAVADSNAAATTSAAAPPPQPPQPAPNSLPAQIEAMVVEINAVLSSFPKYPPHTIQRLAELVLEPRRHYRHLASYLHAVDRVVHVTSGANVYPLPPAIPDASAMTLLSSGGPNGSGGPHDPAAAVSWGNSTNSVASTVGTDEALGGALLTPIPWLTRRPSPGSASPASSSGGGGPAEIRTEHTETIDGPNGVGSIETVSVSVNGIPSMGARNNGGGSNSPSSAGPGPGPGPGSNSAAPRAITQGELLRQEQEQGVVPALQIARQAEEAHHAAALRAAAAAGPGGGPNHSPEKQHAAAAAAAAAVAGATQSHHHHHHHLSGSAAAEDLEGEGEGEGEEETPHARGPEEIGVDDLGPQSVTTSFVGPGIEMQGIDVEAAVGRRAEPRDNTSPPPALEEEDVAVEEAPSSATVEAENAAAAADDDAASETSTTSHAKRDANEELEGVASKKIKEGEGDVATAGEATRPQAEEESKEAAEESAEEAKPAEEKQAKKDDESAAEAGTTTSEDPKTE